MNKAKIFSAVAIMLTLSACSPKEPTGNENLPEANNNSSNNVQTMKLQPEKGDQIATISTNHGDIKILLYPNETPKTVANFVGHINAGHYNGVIFHRIISDFMIQTGDFENGNGTGGYPFEGKGTILEDEFVPALTHVYGAVSMANMNIPNTGGSQFFIVQNSNGTSWLNGKHSVFGYVFEGMDVVEKIAALETGASDRPLEDAVMENVTVSTY